MADRQRDFPAANARAKRMRGELTLAERRLWSLLRRMEGFHVRKQVPVGPHVFDFGDHGQKLLIELDGGIHALPEVQVRDAVKDARAREQGFTVVRIPNDYVFGTGEDAVAMIKAAAKHSAKTNGRKT